MKRAKRKRAAEKRQAKTKMRAKRTKSSASKPRRRRARAEPLSPRVLPPKPDPDAIDPVLPLALEAAVPLHIMELQRQPWSVIQAIARGCCDEIAHEKGAALQFKYRTKHHAADAFNSLARGLACLSFLPGGVTWLGLHFEAEHPEARREAGAA